MEVQSPTLDYPEFLGEEYDDPPPPVSPEEIWMVMFAALWQAGKYIALPFLVLLVLAIKYY